MPRPRLLTFPHSDPLHEHNLVRMRTYLTGHPEVSDVSLSGSTERSLYVTFVNDEEPLRDTVLDRMPWADEDMTIDPLRLTEEEAHTQRALATGLGVSLEYLGGSPAQARGITDRVAQTMREVLLSSRLGLAPALPRMRELIDRPSLARQMFQVQELPSGALPSYERDPDLHSFATARVPMVDPGEVQGFLTNELEVYRQIPFTAVLREPGPERTAYDHLNEDCQG